MSKEFGNRGPKQAWRATFTHHMMRVSENLLQARTPQDLKILVPVAYRATRVLLADAIARDSEIEDRLESIDEDESFLEQAKDRVYRKDQDPERIARRERTWAKFEELSRLAVRKGLWGHEEKDPHPESEELVLLDEERDGGL